MTVEGRQVFHKGAIIAWGRSIGVPHAIAIAFMQKAGVTIIDDCEPAALTRRRIYSVINPINNRIFLTAPVSFHDSGSAFVVKE
jgi:hypothetical protein